MSIRFLLDQIRRLPVVRRQFRSLEKKRQRRQIAASPDPKTAFTIIYRENVWGSRESISGNGSTLASTEAFRAEFAALLGELGVRSILDAPCGDFNWMRLVALPSGTRYIGADIVDEIITRCRARHASPEREFVVLDIIRDDHPTADLWLCRDALIHLSNADALSALTRFVGSGTKFCLITTRPDVARNRDIPTGLTRPVNLTAAPFLLPPPRRMLSDRPVRERPRMLGLWTRQEVAAALGRAPRS